MISWKVWVPDKAQEDKKVQSFIRALTRMAGGSTMQESVGVWQDMDDEPQVEKVYVHEWLIDDAKEIDGFLIQLGALCDAMLDAGEEEVLRTRTPVTAYFTRTKGAFSGS